MGRPSWLVFVILGLLIPVSLPAFGAQPPGADFSLECVETKEVLLKNRTFADCTVTSLNGFDGRVFISCDTDVPSIGCHPTWHPYVSPAVPVQTVELHNSGYVSRAGNGTIGTWTVIGTSVDGEITHTATLFQSMFVIPEFPIGGIAVVLSSLGALGLYLKTRHRS
jgi:hypothetical protein